MTPGRLAWRGWGDARVLIAAGLLVAALGCHRRHVDGTSSVDSVLSSWSAAGTNTDAVKELDGEPWSADACSRGVITGLDVLLCEFQAGDRLAVGERRVRDSWSPETVSTGVVVHNARTMLAIVDHGDADPSGRITARLLSSFEALR
jgi:hypothetical protein